MILESITLHNFGVYKGRQTIDLTPKGKNRPIILFGGLNGNGKTTLLDALQLSLYGQLAKTSNRGTQAYEKYLQKCINRAAPPEEGAAIELKFKHNIEGAEHTYQIQRNWKVSGNPDTAREQLTVIRDGVKDSLLTESWDEYVQGLIPSQIAGLFFFDGEKIAEIADTEASSDFLRTAIHSLLGLDIVDRLKADLSVLEKREKKSVASKEGRSEIEAKETEALAAEAEKDKAHQEMGAAQAALEDCEKRYCKVDKEYRKHGGALYEKRTELSAKQNALTKEIHANDDRLRELAAGSLPLSLVQEQLKKIRKSAVKEVESKKDRILVNELEQRDAVTLEALKKLNPEKNLLDTFTNVLVKDRKKRVQRSEKTKIVFDATSETVASLDHLLSIDLPQNSKLAKSLSGLSEKLQAQRDDLERQLEGIPDPEALVGLSKNLRELELEKSSLVGSLAAQDAEYQRLLRSVSQRDSELKKLYHQHVGTLAGEEEALRVIDSKSRLQAILDQFKQRVADENLARLENLILDSFQNLMRKKQLVAAIEIDRLSFELRMIAANGSEVLPDRLSAGERQLLAVSMLWGLAKASGRPLPAVIDTPLGRLDSTHRQHLVERYFPNASHQVLLLSTDEEIDQVSYSKIEKRLGRVYELVHDNKTQSTSVTEGYFWKP